MKLPLFSKILIWFFLSLIILALVLFGLFKIQFKFNPESPFQGQLDDKITLLAWEISQELSYTQKPLWDSVLAEYSEKYGVEFALFSNEAVNLAGYKRKLPLEVVDKILIKSPSVNIGHGTVKREKPVQIGNVPMDMPPQSAAPPKYMPIPPKGDPREKTAHATFAVHTKNPKLYWMGIRVPVVIDFNRMPMPATLIAVSDSFMGNGLFFDPVPWLLTIFAVFTVSALIWLPFIRNLTKPLSQMTEAAEKISKGEFDIKLNINRSDEFGRLSRAINDMSNRLDHYIKGQKRFMGDVAHELSSPIARIKLGLAIIEEKMGGMEESKRLGKVSAEVEHMSQLVEELLSFTRAQIKPESVNLTKVNLKELVIQVIERESGGLNIEKEIEEGLFLQADSKLLLRALSNLLRNAVRYAGQAGPIKIVASKKTDGIEISVVDSGSGVPEQELQKLFEPFYRVESSRDRNSGGTGLGLAIVKSCVEACGGSVRAKNIVPAGFEVIIAFEEKK